MTQKEKMMRLILAQRIKVLQKVVQTDCKDKTYFEGKLVGLQQALTLLDETAQSLAVESISEDREKNKAEKMIIERKCQTGAYFHLERAYFDGMNRQRKLWLDESVQGEVEKDINGNLRVRSIAPVPDCLKFGESVHLIIVPDSKEFEEIE